MAYRLTAVVGLLAMFASLAFAADRVPASAPDPAVPRRPAIHIAPPPPAKGVYAGDEQIADAIKKGDKWLTTQVQGGIEPSTKPATEGVDALCIYSLLGSWKERGYERSAGNWDNANSQYGLMGIVCASKAGAKIPPEFWKAVQKHWLETQLPDGGWGYDAAATASTPAMTFGGVASLLACRDQLDVIPAVGADSFSPALKKGLAWMAQGEHAGKDVTDGPAAFALQRVGLATGFKYFGTHDWYHELATRLVRTQQADGSWPAAGKSSARTETAYNLIFLARGPKHIMMSKLRFDGAWNNRPNDLAHLTQFCSRELCGALLNWQVVPLDDDAADWSNAPILYIASHDAPKFTDADYAKLRAYVDGGGMLFTHADNSSAAFNAFVEKTLVRKLFPNYEMAKVQEDNPLITGWGMRKHLPLLMVNNGARALLVHCPTDIAEFWQANTFRGHNDAFQTGLGMFMYAVGKHWASEDTTCRFIPAPPPSAVGNTIRVARIKYATPAWDPEPGAWPRFARWMGWQTGVGIVTEPVDMEGLGKISVADVPLADLCGTASFVATDAQIDGLRQYVQAGGVLFIDMCGTNDFNESATKLLARAFPDQTLKRINAAHPLLTASDSGMSDVSRIEVRSYTQSKLGSRAGGFQGFSAGKGGMSDLARPRFRASATRLHGEHAGEFLSFKDGKGCVIVSSLDVTCGLLGTYTWIDGYESSYALNFMKNLTLWAARGARDEPAAHAPAAPAAAASASAPASPASAPAGPDSFHR